MGGTHTTVHTTQANQNRTIYFTAWGSPWGPSPVVNHFLSGRITDATGATSESCGELVGGRLGM